MPTGYTADVADGKVTDFVEFACKCAHEFGALIELRDSMPTAQIPEFKPSDYHSHALKKAKDKRRDLIAMDDETATREAQREYKAAIRSNAEAVRKIRQTRSNYEAMLEKVAKWSPPSKDHRALKDFMLRQLKDSLDGDCNEDYFLKNRPKRLSGPEWRAERLARIERDVVYHTEEHDKEVARVNARNRWVQQLKESLGVR